MSATLASLYKGLLRFSMLTYFSKARIFHTAIKNGQLLWYGHAYQLNDRTNVKNNRRVHACTAGRCENKHLHLRTIVQRN